MFNWLIYSQGRPNMSFKGLDLSFALIQFEGHPGFDWNKAPLIKTG